MRAHRLKVRAHDCSSRSSRRIFAVTTVADNRRRRGRLVLYGAAVLLLPIGAIVLLFAFMVHPHPAGVVESATVRGYTYSSAPIPHRFTQYVHEQYMRLFGYKVVVYVQVSKEEWLQVFHKDDGTE
jgi:hypothetical protein